MTPDPLDLNALRIEMIRLTHILMIKNARYAAREAELTAQYGHDLTVLRTRLSKDYELNKASGAAKTCATLITGLANVIVAELAWATYRGEPG